MKIMRVLIAAGTVGMLVRVAEAQGPPPDPARRAALVRRFDTDGDGRLSAEELKAAGSARKKREPGPNGARPAQRVEAKKIANDEMIEALLRQFDADGNGKLDYAEMDALRTFMKTRRPGDRNNEDGAVPHAPPRGARHIHGPAPEGEAHE